jgi:hypothetical protein
VGSNLFNNLQNRLIIRITFFPTIFPQKAYASAGFDHESGSQAMGLRIL